MPSDQGNGETDLLSQLREKDPERYIACLYLPQEIREAAACLYLFDAEITRIPDLISEPMPGEIRIQFWKDLIAGSGDSQGGGPLGEALLQVIETHQLPRETLHNYLDARIFDLYHDPMPDTGTLEGYLGETHSAMFQLVAFCAGLKPDTALANVSGHAGIAFGMTRLLAGISWHHHNKRTYVPVTVLEQYGLAAETWLSEPIGKAHLEVIREMTEKARDHLQLANSELPALPQNGLAVFLPLAFVEPTLQKIEKRGADLFRKPVILGSLQRQWAALRWAMKR